MDKEMSTAHTMKKGNYMPEKKLQHGDSSQKSKGVQQPDPSIPDCLFCRIIRGDIPSMKVYEDKDFFAFLDIGPINKGHTLLVPKGHYPDFLVTPDPVLSRVYQTAKKIALALESALGADGFNISTNIRPAAGQIIFHTHIHIIPRFAGDGFVHWKGKPLSQEEMQAVVKKVRGVLG